MKELLPLGVVTSVSPFKQLVERGVDQLQENISNRLHNHSFTNIHSNLPFDLHQTHLRSCVGIWLLACLIILFFHLALNVFSTTLCTRLGFSHPLVLGVSHWICNQPLDPMGIHLLCCVHWICMLTNIVITNPTQVDLFSQVVISLEVVAIVIG
jgi:hypothetical protein